MLYVRSLRQIQWGMYTHVLLITLLTPLLLIALLIPYRMSDHNVRYIDECTHMCYWKHYHNHVVCQINMSDLMMNVNTCLTDRTTYIMLYVRSIYLVQWWVYTHLVLITLLTPCCMSNHYPWFNDECTHIFYWVHYLHHGVYHINVSDLMVNVHTCITDIPTYMVYLRSFCQIW